MFWQFLPVAFLVSAWMLPAWNLADWLIDLYDGRAIWPRSPGNDLT